MLRILQRFGRRCFGLRAALVFALASSAAAAQAPTPAEQRAVRAFEAAEKLGPPALYAFLRPMPKGADLHMHLSGAVYAETFLAEAVKQNLCIDPAGLSLTAPAPAASAGAKAACAGGNVPAATALIDQHLYDRMVDSLSMRDFVPSSGISGHDHFFATFERFSVVPEESGPLLEEVVHRAAAQNEQYLEIMTTPPFANAAKLGYKFGWPGTDATVTREQLARLRDQLLAAGLRDEVATDAKALDDMLAARANERCDATAAPASEASTPEAPPAPSSEAPPPGATRPRPSCGVAVHFLYQVLRGYPAQQVFAQTLLGFEAVAADQATPHPRWVGINFVMPEDGRLSMKDYHLQMLMLDYLHSVYPTVKISLHAGELAPGLVPPAGLDFHIRQAINLGHASRIGHGVDVLYERNPTALLHAMAAQHIMVEINLTSNDVILGVKGNDHPLHAYLAAHVPVALSTDDEGVSRIDLTHEYVRAATEQGLGYLELKRMARTSLEYAFFSGESLWERAAPNRPDDFTHRVAACAGPIQPLAAPGAECARFLAANERARQQYELEQRFAAFEADLR